MSASVRSCVHVAIGCALACASLAAPEHVHEADDYHHRVVHHHVTLHQPSGASVDDEEGPVVWLSQLAIAVAAQRSAPPVAIIVASVAVERPVAIGHALHQPAFAVAHGPPRSDLPARAPPASV